VKPLESDLSVYDKFDFENPPVGVKFLLGKPEGIEQLDKSLPICEMIKEAHRRETPFYITKENEDCFGKVPMGWGEIPFAEGGYIGEELGIYQEARANSRLYLQAPKFSKGVVNYVAFSKLDKLTFEPDLLILLANPNQAEIVLRAMTYKTGAIYESKTSIVLACAWLFTYPYQQGKVNFMLTGLDHGMTSREIFSAGQVLISIPYDWIPVITQNLKEIKWVLPQYTEGRERFLQRAHRIVDKLTKQYQNP
jgi:uncharacterized protein (DUF169 family)